MQINLAIVQIALIFFPGIIWAAIDAKFFAVYSALSIDHPLQHTISQSRDAAIKTLSLRDVFITTLIALVLSVLWLYSERYKLVARFLQTVRATKNYGDEDVWDFTFNSSHSEVEYIHLRDFKNGLVYAGWVNTFSQSGKLRELVLRDVEVYNFDGLQLMELPLIYLAFDPSDTHIEFPSEQTVESTR